MFKGCLNKILIACAAAIIGLAIITGIFYGGYVYLKNEMQAQFNPTQEQLKLRAKKLVDLSAVPAGYAVTKAIDMTGINAVITEYSENNQVMAVVDPGWVTTVDRKDLMDGALERKIKKYLSQANNDKIKIDVMDVKQKQAYNAFNQTIPCLEAEFILAGKQNVPSGKYRAVVGVVKNPAKNKNNLILSFNSSEKYNQLVVDEFFKNVRFTRESSEN